MAYGFHPQLYPYLYAPKNPLSLSSGYEQSMSDRSISPPPQQQQKSSSKDRDEEKSSSGDVSSKAATDEECMIDESENVEID